jgi:hypothetical protein
MSAKEMSPEAVAGLQHVVSVYGYIVVAFDHPVKVGKIFTMFAGGWSTVQPFRVMAPATYEEWQGQLEECARFGYVNQNAFPMKDVPMKDGYFFYRAVTE